MSKIAILHRTGECHRWFICNEDEAADALLTLLLSLFFFFFFFLAGIVGVGEASVMIAVSSPHRRDSLEGVSWCIDELKRVLCVWKKEQYEDGSVWKQNEEFDADTLTDKKEAATTGATTS